MRVRLVGLAMLVLVGLPSVVRASNHTPCPATPVHRNLPLRIVDGDTFRLNGERIRIVGIDTPERGQPGSGRATYRLLTLLRSGPLVIARHGRDVYCRTLADVYVNGWNVAEILRSEGFDKGRPTSRSRTPLASPTR
jgi:endonuclease YncB( thermonuclease family)